LIDVKLDGFSGFSRFLSFKHQKRFFNKGSIRKKYYLSISIKEHFSMIPSKCDDAIHLGFTTSLKIPSGKLF
jgi:hypothetical protein